MIGTFTVLSDMDTFHLLSSRLALNVLRGKKNHEEWNVQYTYKSKGALSTGIEERCINKYNTSTTHGTLPTLRTSKLPMTSYCQITKSHKSFSKSKYPPNERYTFYFLGRSKADLDANIL